LKIFGHQACDDKKNLVTNKLGDQNLFLVANHNKGSPSVNKYFIASILIDAMNALGQTFTRRPTQNGRVMLISTTLFCKQSDHV
jgi:hypothetical protein